jgi:chloramphenicol 3-O-phosphotransferase
MQTKVPAKLIFLNGASKATRHELAEQLQKSLDEPFLYFGIETLLYSLPESYVEGDHALEGFYQEEKLWYVGPYGKRVIAGMAEATKVLLEKGLNLIMDEDCNVEALKYYQRLYAKFTTLFVDLSDNPKKDQSHYDLSLKLSGEFKKEACDIKQALLSLPTKTIIHGL